MLKFSFIFFGCIMPPIILSGQKEFLQGEITYIGQENIYARFSSTENIQIGDSIYININNKSIPIFIVNQKSSSSVVGKKITSIDIQIGTKVAFEFNTNKTHQTDQLEKKDSLTPIISQVKPVVSDSVPDKINNSLEKRENISGRIALTANANINENASNYQAFRAAFSFNLKNLNNSPFSFSTYMIYRHRYGVEQQQRSFFDDYKIFDLAANYQKSKTNIWLGRKINNYIANIGAIDGVQADYAIGRFKIGAFGGSRPDFINYSFNLNLIQYGAYIVHENNGEKNYSQSSLAFANQLNSGQIDRQFLYFQHNNNNLVKNLSMFLSSEVDLYSKIAGVASHQFSLTGLYLMLRYRILKNLSVSASYDNRRNIIYYESYQTFIDQLISQETRQGFRFQISYSPTKRINLNTSAFFRYQGNNPRPSTNYYGNLSFYRFPMKNSTFSVNANYLNAEYHKALIYGARLNHNILKGKGQFEINFRNVAYRFYSLENATVQNIFGISFSYNLLRYTMLMLTYEGTLQKESTNHRYYITLIQRFKSKKK